MAFHEKGGRSQVDVFILLAGFRPQKSWFAPSAAKEMAKVTERDWKRPEVLAPRRRSSSIGLPIE